MQLADAVTHGKMSRLSHLSFISCTFVTLSPLTEMKWPNLSHFSFQSCNLGKLNCESLAEAISYKYINLTSLAVMDQHVEHFLDRSIILKHGLLGITRIFFGFYLRNDTISMAQVVEMVNDQKFPICPNSVCWESGCFPRARSTENTTASVLNTIELLCNERQVHTNV